MHDLVEKSIEAHGGIEQWKKVRQISATIVPDGLALKLRGHAAFAGTPKTVTIDTREQYVTFEPFLAAGQKSVYEPDRTAVVASNGTVVEELKNPRDSFRNPGEAPWSATQLAYFTGYAIWTYFTLPFSLVTEGVGVEEVEPWAEDGESWRGLKLTFPDFYATHSREQVLYIDEKGFLRRLDYSVDIAGNGTAAHYIHNHQKFDGIVFPTQRRIYPRADRKVDKDVVIMSADLTDIKLSDKALFRR